MTEPARAIGFWRAALHLGGLWALAFAQPLFDQLGRNAQFFVARGSTAGDILVLALGYTLVPPLAGAALVWALGRVRPAAGRAAHLVLVGALAAALVLPPAGDALGGSAVAIPAAIVVGAACAALYARSAAARAFASVLSPAPLVVLVLLLVASPVRELVLPGDDGGVLAGPSRSTTPIVQIVLDELPQSTLADGRGRIDAGLFPHLARLAREATWYRNATTVDDLTTEAVPAQLTGRLPRRGSLPTVRDHPRNLFTLFGRSHDLTVVEPITDLCPARLCGETRAGTLDRLRALGSDLKVVVQQLLAPEDLRAGLPPIDRVWEGFEGGVATEGELRGGSDLREDVLARLRGDDATAGFARAMAALDRPRSRPPLLFVHSTLPHGPWRFLPDGRRYPMHRGGFPGLDTVGWIGPQWLVDQGFQRHLLQVRYVDRLVGALLDKLRDEGLYDDAVVVVSADHGAAFRRGQPRRPANRANAQDIAGVPLLVKLPGQRTGGPDDRAVRTIDVLPTIADAAGRRMPWRVDGMPAERRPVDPGARIDVTHAGAPALSTRLGAILRARREREAVEAGLLRGGVYAMGPAPQLVGRAFEGIARPVASGPRATIDGADDYGAVDGRAAVLPAFVSGEVTGLPADAVVAVAVNGRVEATTRVYRSGSLLLYGAVVPPSALRDGANAVTVLEVLPGDRLRPIGATPST